MNEFINGKFILILGSMKSGKSTKLLQYVDKAKYRKKKILLIRPSIDTREFISRNMNVDIDTIKAASLREVGNAKLFEYDVICIDEAHFFPDLGDAADYMARYGKEVIAAGLNGDSDLDQWPAISAAIPLADKIERMSAVCENCHCDDATFTYYTKIKEDQVVIGDGEYMAVCRKCWHELTYEKYREFE